ncbi:MAG: hypothetical protein ABI806_18555 [Candidatus Solibacter sp.]
MIELLNKYFVPVTSPNEWAESNGAAPPAEKAERQRIYLYFYAHKMGIGDVHVYVVAPNGDGVGGMDINSAGNTEKMIAFLTKVVGDLRVTPGPPAIAPHPVSVAPAAPADSLVLHLVSRSMAGGSWHEFPSENWIVLSKAEWQHLLPVAGAARGAAWTVPKPVAVKLVEWIYPQNEEKTGVNRSRVDLADLKMTLVTLENGLARARIEGQVKLMHSFYPAGKNEDLAISELSGYLDFNVAERRIQRLRLVTDKATYVGTPFRASLVSMSRETLDALK